MKENKQIDQTKDNKTDLENSDSSEELQYGPGIVNRLKTKYLSLTTKEYSKKNIRPPLSALTFRRANSLENLLAENEKPGKTYALHCAQKFESQTATDDVIKPPNRISRTKTKGINAKRARSLECVLRNFNEVVIEENCASDTSKTTPVADLPPPDVVKETVKLFEKSPPNSKLVETKPFQDSKTTVDLNGNTKVKVAGPGSNNEKPLVSPKPIIITQCHKNPRDLKTNSNHSTSPNTHSVVHKNKPSNKSFTISSLSQNGTLHDKPAKPSKPINCVSGNTKDIQRSNNNVRFDLPDIIKRDSAKVENGLNNNNNFVNKIQSSNNCCPVENHKTTNNLSLGGIKNDKLLANECSDSKSVSSLALNNIRKSGTTVEFKFPFTASKSYLPKDRSNNNSNQRQIGIIKPFPNKSPPINAPPVDESVKLKSHLESSKEIDIVESTKKIAIEEPIMVKKIDLVESVKKIPLQESVNEVESTVEAKNRVNKALLNLKTENTHLWDSKPWHHRQNTMVFNFCNRKDVPDYIENDGLCLANKTDSEGKPRYMSEPTQYLTEFCGPVESSTDDIVFEGANVVINKSNLQKSRKACKLSIQFDLKDYCYVYPSENSFEDMTSSSEFKSNESHSINDESSLSNGNSVREIFHTVGRPDYSNPVESKKDFSLFKPSKVDTSTFEFGVKPFTIGNTKSNVVSPTVAESNATPSDNDCGSEDERYSRDETSGLLY